MPLGNATSYLQNIFLLNIFLKIPEMIDHSKSKNIFRAVGKYLFRHLEPESMATPTVQNCPNLFSEATLIPLLRTVILESSVCLLEDT